MSDNSKSIQEHKNICQRLHIFNNVYKTELAYNNELTNLKVDLHRNKIANGKNVINDSLYIMHIKYNK